MERIVTLINDIELSQQQRKLGVQLAFDEILVQVDQHPIVFTIAGFFVIKKSFFASVCTGIVTYLIVLLQFYKV